MHALGASIDQNLECQVDCCEWAWPVTYLLLKRPPAHISTNRMYVCYVFKYNEGGTNGGALKGVGSVMINTCALGLPPSLNRSQLAEVTSPETCLLPLASFNC